ASTSACRRGAHERGAGNSASALARAHGPVPARRSRGPRPGADELPGPGARHEPPDGRADPHAAYAAAGVRGAGGRAEADRRPVPLARPHGHVAAGGRAGAWPRIDQLPGPGAWHEPSYRRADPYAAYAAARLRGD